MEITASTKSPLGEAIEITVTLPDRFSAEAMKPVETLVRGFCGMLEHNLRSIPDIPMAVSIMMDKMEEAANILAAYGKLISEGKITREEIVMYHRLQNRIASARV